MGGNQQNAEEGRPAPARGLKGQVWKGNVPQAQAGAPSAPVQSDGPIPYA